MAIEPVLPDYEDRCISNVLEALQSPRRKGPLADLRSAVLDAPKVVLVLLDGLGAEQLAERAAIAPWLTAHQLDPITSVAPSTTAAALSSITTGEAPGRHGMVGYRFEHEGQILQSLRWTVDGKDARKLHSPEQVQPLEPKLAGVPYVGRADFQTSAFTAAHLRGADYRGAKSLAAMIPLIIAAIEESPLVLAYHDAIDKVSHKDGFGSSFDAAVIEADQFLSELRSKLAPEVAVVVTSDHGQVDIGGASVDVSPATDALVAYRSGEGRFRWLHAVPGQTGELLRRTHEELGDSCWVKSRRQIANEGWLGEMDDEAEARLGDVAVVPFAPVFVPDPEVPKEVTMRGRHGSLTAAEMLVPLVVG
jgi:hypothetical protein